MVIFALIGAGSVGRVHAASVAGHPKAQLGPVFDIQPHKAAALVGQFGGHVVSSLDDALGDDAHALIIASSTASHGQVAQACVAAGKPFLCEKPLAFDVTTALKIVEAAEAAGLTTAMALNRRLDYQYAGIKAAVDRGEIGRLESMLFTSRSAGLPTVEFVSTSGGLLGEKGSHFYDLACWISGEYPLEVHAMGSTLINPGFAVVGEVDTAMITLRMPSGLLCQFDFSWRAAYGHDERLEVHGALGMLRTEQDIVAPYTHFSDVGFAREGRLAGWFDRFAPTYEIELDLLIQALETGEPTQLPTLADCLAAQRIADAARQSIVEGRRISLEA